MNRNIKIEFLKHRIKTRAPVKIKKLLIDILLIASLGTCAINIIAGL